MYTMYYQHGSTEYDTGYYSEMLNNAATCPSFNAKYYPESDPKSQPQCRYRISRTRSIFGATITFEEGDDTAGFATPLNANNYRTRSAGTKHHETHSPIAKASNSEKCTQRSNGKRTSRWIKMLHRQVTIPNEIPTQSRRSRFSLNNPEIHSCYWKSTSESSLINQYNTRRSRNWWVVSRATTYKRGMTIPEW